MEENLLGYLMQSLDPETHRQVEQHLRQNPGARRRLERLRQALEPLAGDADVEPPPGLWVRTLAHIAHDQCRRAEPIADQGSPFRKLPSAPRSPWSDDGGSGRTPWRWLDALVLAAIVLLSASFVVIWLSNSWRDQLQVACQNNLREMHGALTAYSDLNHREFPKVDETPPANVAGIYAPALRDAGVLTNAVSLTCPSRGKSSPAIPGLAELRTMPPDQIARVAEQMAGDYAYSLGYGEPGQLVGLRSDADHGYLPILADRPQLQGGRWAANSPNHGGRGQNVLFIDGHVQFFTVPTVGVDGDNIFVNQQGFVAAGRSRFDSVLGSGAAHPFPPE